MVTRTTEKRSLFEAGAIVGESASENGTWKVRIINEGKGSSGTWPAETLEKYHHAFDDRLSFTNHPSGWEGPQSRDFTMLAGEIKGATWIEKDDRGLTAVYGNFLPDAEHKEKLERYRHKLGLSVFIEGAGYVDDNGEFVVDWLDEHDDYASVDVVLAAGRGGRFEESMKKMYAQRSAESASANPAGEKNEPKGLLRMEQDVKDRFDKIEAALDVIAGSHAQEAQATADEQAIESAVAAATTSIKAQVEAVEAAKADLLPSQYSALLEGAWAGKDVADGIASGKKIAVEAKEAYGARGTAPLQETGRLGESASADTYKFKGFGD